MKKKISFLFGTLTSLLFLLTYVAYAWVAPVQITTDPAGQGRPDVYGDIIVWKDNRFTGKSYWDIFAYNLAADPPAEEPVTTAPGYQNVPATNGSIVVWQDDRDGSPLKNDIWMKSIIPEGDESLLVSAPGHLLLPAIEGNTVVFVSEAPGGAGTETDPSNDIWAVDVADYDGDGLLEGGEPYPVCTAAGSQWQPRISGTNVVWQDNRNGHWNIWAKDLATTEDPFAVTEDTDSDNKVADIDGNLAVWQKTTGGVKDIWMKDLSSGDGAIAVTNDAASQNSPRVSGDLIVWEDYDYQRANWDILMKDLTSGVLSTLAGSQWTEARPAIDKETVVWEADGPAGFDVWMARVPDTTPPQVNRFTPDQDTSSGCDYPVISAGYSDNRAGIDTSAVRLNLDGDDVTQESSVTADSITYRPRSPLAEGPHAATVSVADRSGNVSLGTWKFTTNRRQLRLSMVRSYWATAADWANRELSVEFMLTNSSPDIRVVDAEVLAATATGGVIAVTGLPLPLGDINTESSAMMVLKYKIPGGSNSFRTNIFVGFFDECGDYHVAPGPPPGG